LRRGARGLEFAERVLDLGHAREHADGGLLRQHDLRQADTIVAFATQWASRIEGKGSEEATAYYEKMKEYSDLATFLAWLDALKAGLRGSTTYIGDTTRAPFHLLDLDAPVGANGIPQPSGEKKQSASATATESER
ncbi:MAG: hypothetical protein ACK5C3_13325, partial [bacterium]